MGIPPLGTYLLTDTLPRTSLLDVQIGPSVYEWNNLCYEGQCKIALFVKSYNYITAVQFHQLLLSSECGIASSSNIYLGFCQIKRRTGITMRNVADMLRATHQLTWPWYCPFLQAPWYSSPSPYWKHLRRMPPPIRISPVEDLHIAQPVSLPVDVLASVLVPIGPLKPSQ